MKVVFELEIYLGEARWDATITVIDCPPPTRGEGIAAGDWGPLIVESVLFHPASRLWRVFVQDYKVVEESQLKELLAFLESDGWSVWKDSQ